METRSLPTIPLCSPEARYTYHVVASAACMPASCKFGVYRRVAVIEVDHHERPLGYVPERVADLRGVRITWLADRLNVGKTADCAYNRALIEARAFANTARMQRVFDCAAESAGLAA